MTTYRYTWGWNTTGKCEMSTCMKEFILFTYTLISFCAAGLRSLQVTVLPLTPKSRHFLICFHAYRWVMQQWEAVIYMRGQRVVLCLAVLRVMQVIVAQLRFPAVLCRAMWRLSWGEWCAAMGLVAPLPIVPLSLITSVTRAKGRKAVAWFLVAGLSGLCPRITY